MEKQYANDTPLMQTALIKFDTSGNLRFLSHGEMVRLLQRACVRASIKVRYSQGFNPRLKMSLPLPRTVGLQTQGDLLVLHLQQFQQLDSEQLIHNLQNHLPLGLELISAQITEKKAIPQPCRAVYLITVAAERINDDLKDNLSRIRESKTLTVQRRAKKAAPTKAVDIREFLETIEICGNQIKVEYKITGGRTVRFDEILGQLGLEQSDLDGPARRTNIEWAAA